jgi:phosphoglycerate dehydrogenase-like enzyme
MTTPSPTLYVDRPLPPGFEELFAGKATVVGPDPADLAMADGVIAGAATWGPEEIARAPDSLEVISRAGIGYDAVDLAAATAAGVVVCNAPEAPTVSTAEHAVALLMVAAKRLAICQKRLRLADGDYFAANDGLELDGRTLGLLGYGRISRRVGVVGAAMGMNVIAYDPYLTGADVELVSFDDLLARADVISLHAPLTTDTRHLFDTSAFARMRVGSVLVNTARGGLVDHTALMHALDHGPLFAAGLDVTEPEPLPADHPLLSRDDVFVTPHIASSTDRGKRRLYDHAIDNALTVIAGGRPANVVNPEVYDR